MALPVAQIVRPAGSWEGAVDSCALDYEARFFRRRKLTVAGGWSFVADFEQTVSLNAGDALELPDGRLIEIQAAPEALLVVEGSDLVRLAWHIGNRHTPCQVEPARLLIRDDPVIGHMLEHLGARLTPVTEPFTPEGGAYGHGRTHSHEHGHTSHAH
jgi:urease accessory protein